MTKPSSPLVAACVWGAFLLVPAYGSAREPTASCERMARLALPHTLVTLAQPVAAGGFRLPQRVDGPAAQVGRANDVAFCRVAATLTPSTDSHIRMEVWLPLSGWNGKLVAAGNGGWAGRMAYSGMLPALQQGYSAASTDTGHDASMPGQGGGEFIIGHPERLIDYAYRAHHLTTLAAKAIISAFYGRSPAHSYWVGCSLGGLEGLIEAKRFPEDFDGIVVGSPPNPITAFNAAQIWPAWLISKDPARYIPPSKLPMIHEAALKACASPIGLKHGFIEEPDRCQFDPGVLLCTGEDAPDCLTAPQLDLMRRIYAGPANPRTHEPIFAGLSPGAELQLPKYSQPAEAYSTALDLFKYAAFHDADWDWRTFDFDRVLAAAEREVGPILHVDSNLNPFFDRGGKLLMYIGGTEYKNFTHMRDYYLDILRNAGAGKEGSVRLFLVPGMDHCGGGAGCDTFDKLGPIDAWVEHGRAPERIPASQVTDGTVVRTRPICAYPLVARYRGTGNIDDAESFVCATAFPPSGPTVAVTGGEINGRALQGGAVFKGIPFAAPPVADLRWKPPMPVKAWSGVRDAGEYGAPCAQDDRSWNRNSAVKSKEDCLFLNVWTPEWPPGSKKPVLVWIHGGGNAGGSALGSGGIEPPFDGESLSRHGVVVVTVQYRLGVFGFLAHPELTAESPHHASGNYAILDLIAALDWIKQNITRFGGDPANVTLFGQSAGGNDIGQLLVSPLSSGLFARAIEQSGTVMGNGRLTPTLAEAERAGVALASKMGAPATGALAHLRASPVQDLLKTSRDLRLGPVADGYVIEDVSARTFAAGKQKKVPLLIGSNARERSLDGGPDALEKAVAEFYGDLAPRAVKLYSGPSDYPPYGDAGAQFVTDTMNRCPTLAIEAFHAAAGNVVWAYEFSHPFPDAERGAEHSGELRYVFGNFPPGEVADSERKISNEMQAYWTNYARTGDPNGDGLPAWPRFDAETRRYVEFTDNGPVAKENLRGAACRLFDDFMKEKLAQQPASPQAGTPALPCEGLAKLVVPGATITMAQPVAAGEFKIPAGARGPGPAPGTTPPRTPAFCRVAATLKPSSDSDIKMEVWLPMSGWNGKFLGVGNGGWAGRISYTGNPLGLIDAVQRGYAAANTDTGHDASQTTGGSFIPGHPEKLVDYGYRAVHEMTVTAKAIVSAHYGVPPKHSYFIGCSLGGMQAVVEARRFPEDYDGIVAGAPANPMTLFNAAQIWPAWLIAREPSRFIPEGKYTMVHEAALKACATPVGVNDGLIEEPDRCRFDPQELLCRGADGSDCLTAPQVDLMRQIYAGPVNPRTQEPIFPGLAVGGELQLPRFAGKEPHSNSVNLYTYAVHQDPGWDWRTMDFDGDIALANKVVDPHMRADSNLKAFVDRGGKLMIYIGWTDYHNPTEVVDYYGSVLENVGGGKGKESIRLFIIPGMDHCGGGKGCDTFEKLGPMEQWVEDGKAPEQILASKLKDGETIRTRPLCAYPKVARYKGPGDIDDAQNFVCTEGRPEGRR